MTRLSTTSSMPRAPRSAAARLAAAAACALFGWAAGAAGQEAALYPWEAVRDPAVPAPESILGYPLGGRHTTHAGTMRYLEALDAATDRVKVYSYARSHEGRILRYAVVSSGANMARLEELREGMGRLANPRDLGGAEADALVRATPVFVWLAYSVHGDEHSSTEAALAAAYHLASAQDDRTRRILENAVVFVDPLQNPDGRERFIHNHDQAAGPAPLADPAAAEHDEAWPSGRFNHALFDLNRDWLWQTQPETRGKIAAFLAWRPQVYVDFHEMGTDSTYYFAPPARPINVNVPAAALKWFKVIGEGNARMFDALGFDYFTEEVFDLFYPGYGDSWPTLNGAAGMTYEEATAAGLAIEKKDGTVLTLRDAARRHLAASLATAETAAAHREEMLRDFHRARKAAIDEGAAGSVKAWLIPPEPDAGGAGRIAAIMAAHGLEVLRSTEEFTLRAAPAGGGSGGARRFAKGTVILPLSQPSMRLLAAFFDLDPKIDEGTLKEAAESRRLRTDAPFYDVTSWSVPLATGLPAFAALETPRAAAVRVEASKPAGLPGHPEPPPGTEPWPAEPARAVRGDVREAPASDVLPRAAYAYLLPPAGNDALAALVHLLSREGLAVQAAGKPFKLAGRRYPAGTAILKVRRNSDTLHATVAEAASRFGVAIGAAATGLTEEGIDLGSNAVIPLKAPRVAVIYGEPASPTSLGYLLHTLRDRFGLPVVPVRARTLVRSADLRRFDVIVLPDGSPSAYEAAFGPDGVKRLKAWIDSGGTMVTIKGAAAFAADPDVAWTSARLVKRPKSPPLVPSAATPSETSEPPDTQAGGPGEEGREPDSAARAGEAASSGTSPAARPGGPPPGAPAPASDARPAGGEEEESPERVPGAILRVLIEPTHPVAFGYPREASVLVNSSLAFSLSKDGANVAVFAPRDRLRLGGFVWEDSLDLLTGKPFVIVERQDRGSVVLFTEDPNFRGGWEALSRMLLNAVILVPAFAE